MTAKSYMMWSEMLDADEIPLGEKSCLIAYAEELEALVEKREISGESAFNRLYGYCKHLCDGGRDVDNY